MLECSAFRELPRAGALQVAAAAAERGFTNGDPQWCNLGQGQPDVGPIDGAPERIRCMELASTDQAYGPVGGAHSLRCAVAGHYNRLFRTGRRSKYRAANVAIAAGGRLALARLVTALGPTRLGYRTPDYAGFA
ncbi:MAG: pyridoxal phosphate-dependent aminotransferase, partial [Steroidobacteraceae bacterium]